MKKGGARELTRGTGRPTDRSIRRRKYGAATWMVPGETQHDKGEGTSEGARGSSGAASTALPLPDPALWVLHWSPLIGLRRVGSLTQ